MEFDTLRRHTLRISARTKHCMFKQRNVHARILIKRTTTATTTASARARAREVMRSETETHKRTDTRELVIYTYECVRIVNMDADRK